VDGSVVGEERTQRDGWNGYEVRGVGPTWKAVKTWVPKKQHAERLHHCPQRRTKMADEDGVPAPTQRSSFLDAVRDRFHVTAEAEDEREC
jgi:hypothetical protein